MKKYRAYWYHKGRICSKAFHRPSTFVWDAAHSRRYTALWLDISQNPPVQRLAYFEPEQTLRVGGLPDQWIDLQGNLRNSWGNIVFEA
jgi:hypothetical protein